MTAGTALRIVYCTVDTEQNTSNGRLFIPAASQGRCRNMKSKKNTLPTESDNMFSCGNKATCPEDGLALLFFRTGLLGCLESAPPATVSSTPLPPFRRLRLRVLFRLLRLLLQRKGLRAALHLWVSPYDGCWLCCLAGLEVYFSESMVDHHQQRRQLSRLT